MVRVGRQRYAIDMTWAAPALAAETDPTAERQPRGLQVETKFLRLFKPVALGDQIDGWRVCWIGGWDKCRILLVVIVERPRPVSAAADEC
jgi:hypothetical protein